MKKLDYFKRQNWIKNWAGGWSILSSTYLGEQYTRTIKDELGVGLELSLFITKKGFTDCFFEEKSRFNFCNTLAERIIKDENNVAKWCEELKEKTDLILGIIKKLGRKEITKDDFDMFLDAFYQYGVPHRAIKMVVDFLPPELLKKHIFQFTEARVYSEPVYAETEKFMEFSAEQLSKKFEINKNLILSMNKEEFDKFLKIDKLPSLKLLQDRFEATATTFEKGKYEMFNGAVVFDIEKTIFESQKNQQEIKGTVAYNGKAKGTVRIIFDPLKYTTFNKGDILVTSMTRPEYMNLIKRSVAFITDAGGMLSHAAITARELKKPCIVGTEIATKVLKDGDLVELDTELGIVKIISKN